MTHTESANKANQAMAVLRMLGKVDNSSFITCKVWQNEDPDYPTITHETTLN